MYEQTERIKTAARFYIKQGLSVKKADPVKFDNGRPVNWDEYFKMRDEEEAHKITEDEIESEFENAKSIRVITGPASNNLELIRIRQQGNRTLMNRVINQLIKKLKPETYTSLIIVLTKSRNYHIFYRTESPVKKGGMLAKDTKGVSTINLEGIGSSTFIYPTEKYEFIQNNLLNIPTITSEERQIMIEVCNSLTEYEIAERQKPILE